MGVLSGDGDVRDGRFPAVNIVGAVPGLGLPGGRRPDQVCARCKRIPDPDFSSSLVACRDGDPFILRSPPGVLPPDKESFISVATFLVGDPNVASDRPPPVALVLLLTLSARLLMELVEDCADEEEEEDDDDALRVCNASFLAGPLDGGGGAPRFGASLD